jgi:hypothetical protein
LRFAVAHADAGGGGRPFERRGFQVLALGVDLMSELHGFLHGGVQRGFACTLPSFFVVVTKQHVFHGGVLQFS